MNKKAWSIIIAAAMITSSVPGVYADDLSDKKIGHGPYTCDVFLTQNSETLLDSAEQKIF